MRYLKWEKDKMEPLGLELWKSGYIDNHKVSRQFLTPYSIMKNCLRIYVREEDEDGKADFRL